PVAFIRFPAKMKKGTARSGKLCVAVTIFWMSTVGGMLPVAMKTGKAASASAKATGIPMKRKMVNSAAIRSSMSAGLAREGSGQFDEQRPDHQRKADHHGSVQIGAGRLQRAVETRVHDDRVPPGIA